MSFIPKVRHQKTAFDSRAEEDCYESLKWKEKIGEIKDLETQVRVKLLNGIYHHTDFKFTFTDTDETVWAEYKGFEDARWKMVKKIWRYHGPGRLFIYKGRKLALLCVEVITPQKGDYDAESKEETSKEVKN